MVSEVEEIRKEERDTKDRSRPKDRPGAGGQTGNTGGTGGQAVTRMKQRGASVPVTKATAREPHLPSPHSGPSPASLRPPPPPLFCFHGDRRRGASSKHNALWKTCSSGDPPHPRSPRSGPSPEGPQEQPRPRADLRGPPEPVQEHKTPFWARRAFGGSGLPSAEAP